MKCSAAYRPPVVTVATRSSWMRTKQTKLVKGIRKLVHKGSNKDTLTFSMGTSALYFVNAKLTKDVKSKSQVVHVPPIIPTITIIGGG